LIVPLRRGSGQPTIAGTRCSILATLFLAFVQPPSKVIFDSLLPQWPSHSQPPDWRCLRAQSEKVKCPMEYPSRSQSFIDIRDRVQQLAKELASKPTFGGVEALTLYTKSRKVGHGHLCCVYPSSVLNKSYAFQVALIISPTERKMCFCAGAGRAEIKDPKKAVMYRQWFDAAKQRACINSAGNSHLGRERIGRKVAYRKSWRGKEESTRI